MRQAAGRSAGGASLATAGNQLDVFAPIVASQRHYTSALQEQKWSWKTLAVATVTIVAGAAQLVAGVDEVGMGPLAGPVVAAAVILGDDVDFEGLDDSKRVARPLREELAERVRGAALAVGIGLGIAPPDPRDGR